MSLRGANEPSEINVAETFDREDLGALYEAADAEVSERVRILTRRGDRTGAAILKGIWAGHSGAHLARKLGISEGAVSQRISAIRKLLPHFVKLCDCIALLSNSSIMTVICLNLT